MSDSTSEYVTEFKHDTNNIFSFMVIFVSICCVMLIIAVCLILFRIGFNAELEKKILSQPSEQLLMMQKAEDERLVGIDQAMKATIRDYSR